MVRDCAFVDCRTAPGTCVVGPNATLERVSFTNLDCGDAMLLAAEAALQDVVVSGAVPAKLMARPARPEGFSPAPRSPEIAWLDISSYRGDATVLGIPAGAVGRDPERHVLVLAAWQSQAAAWKEAGIGPFSHWRIWVKSLQSHGVMEGIFTLPDAGSRGHAETLAQRETLRSRFELPV